MNLSPVTRSGIALVSLSGIVAQAQAASRSAHAKGAFSDQDFFIIVVLGIALVYFLPAILAFLLGRRNAVAILALNLLLGWTLLGWVGALVWALIKDSEPSE